MIRKRRPETHIQEEKSYSILEKILPPEWVKRKLSPDYGIDLILENYQSIASNKKIYETLGEYLYVQVKSTKKIKTKTVKLYPTGNLSKSQWKEDRTKYIKEELIIFSLDSSLLNTVRIMGSAYPVLLFLVDIETENTYFLCLNDYIEKILRNKNSNYFNKNSISVLIPLKNKINDTVEGIEALKFYFKRTKLISAFSKFMYQHSELEYSLNKRKSDLISLREILQKPKTKDEIIDEISFYLSEIVEYSFWDQCNLWPIIKDIYLNILEIRKLLSSILLTEKNKEEIILKSQILWQNLKSLNSTHEELVRIWFLPNYLSYFLSYSDIPKEYAE